MSEICRIEEQDYLAFVQDREDYTFLASPSAAKKMADRASKSEYIGCYENGNLVAAALLVFYPTAKKFAYAYLPRGPFLDWKDDQAVASFFQALKTYLKKTDALYLLINPYLVKQQLDANGEIVPQGQNNLRSIQELKRIGFLEKAYDPNFEVSFMSVLPLQGKDMATLLKEMDQQTRWSINRAGKYDLEVVQLDRNNREEIEAFSKMMDHTGNRRGFDGYDASFYTSMLNAYGKDLDLWLCYLVPQRLIDSQEKIYRDKEKELEKVQAHLEKMPGSKKFLKKEKVLKEDMALALKKKEEARKLAREQGERILIAGSMFITTKNEMIYLFSGAYDTYLSYNAPYAIHKKAMEKAIALNKPVYNFYGILPHFHKGEEGNSLYEFKKGFGCIVVELLGNYILPIKGSLFSLYNSLKHIAHPIELD